jgi:predicted nucleic acid-binding Zn ribbon protein
MDEDFKIHDIQRLKPSYKLLPEEHDGTCYTRSCSEKVSEQFTFCSECQKIVDNIIEKARKDMIAYYESLFLL